MFLQIAFSAGLGDRHQQNGVNYTLDLNTGLTQILADGTNTYLYGNGRIAQAGSTTEYFLGDALGSVRQLAAPAGTVTLTQSYAPYGDVVSSVGTSQTSYGFTNEATDPNGLVYLRARYYAPSDGRFISRDTWNGDYNRPLSLNRWGYVEGNPVNLTDPSGNHPPFWCQSMPNKAMYETCIMAHYGIDTMSIFELGKYVEGEKGCYSGPTQYRVPGYFEGAQFGLTMPVFVHFTGAVDSVYDFATMEQQKFSVGITSPMGGGFTDMGLGFFASEYGGIIAGFKSSSSITEDYSGPTRVASGGVGFGLVEGMEIGPGVGVGISLSYSKQDPNILGGAWYIGVSLGADILPVADGSIAQLNYVPATAKTDYRLPGGKVDVGRLYSDIWQGNHSGWPIPLHMNTSIMPSIGEATRFVGVSMAAFYVQAYEELHEENK